MNKQTFKPLACILSIGLSILEIGIRIINLLTWGRVGKMWAIELALWVIQSPWNIIWDDEEYPEEEERKDLNLIHKDLERDSMPWPMNRGEEKYPEANGDIDLSFKKEMTLELWPDTSEEK